MCHAARRFQLLSLRLKVAQYRAMEQELATFCGVSRRRAGRAVAAAPAPLALVHPPGGPRRRRA
jgi:hypothetical protein